MTKLAKKASRACPSRLSWFAIGGVATVGALAAYILFWRGLLGVPRNPPPYTPTPTPAPEGPAS